VLFTNKSPAASNWSATECGYDDADEAVGDRQSHDAVGGGAESLVRVEAKVEEQDRDFDEASADEVESPGLRGRSGSC